MTLLQSKFESTVFNIVRTVEKLDKRVESTVNRFDCVLCGRYEVFLWYDESELHMSPLSNSMISTVLSHLQTASGFGVPNTQSILLNAKPNY